MKLTAFIVCLIFLSSIFAPAMAVTVEQLLKDPKLDANSREAIVKSLNRTQSTLPSMEAKDIRKWQELGDAFATTIAAICKTLRVEVNEFLKSDVGKITAAVIIYKMVGKDIIRIFIYGFSLCILTALAILFTKIAIIRKPLLDDKKQPILDDKKQLIYIDKLGWENEGKAYGLVFCWTIWAIFFSIFSYHII
jgi:hypothetical protein